MYEKWIIENVENPIGYCYKYSTKMKKTFPELEIVRGFYFCPIWGKREHWWLKDEYDNVVDPTKAQFPSRGLGYYEEWIEGSEEPTGICMNCGEHVYDNQYFCSEVCETATINHIEGNVL